MFLKQLMLHINEYSEILLRVRTLTRDIDIAILSVCSSVRHVAVFYRKLETSYFLYRTVAQTF